MDEEPVAKQIENSPRRPNWSWPWLSNETSESRPILPYSRPPNSNWLIGLRSRLSKTLWLLRLAPAARHNPVSAYQGRQGKSV